MKAVKKQVNIYIPQGKSVFYANFRTKRRIEGRGEISVQVNRSTGSADRKTAQAIANKMRNDELLGLFDLLPKLRDDGPSVGDLIDRYLSRATIDSASAVARDFLIVVAEGVGIISPEKYDDARTIKLRAALTVDNLLAFRDRKHESRCPASINKMIRTARSILSARAMENYRNMKLPDFTEWMKVALLEEPRTAAYRPVDETELARMDGSAPMMLRLARRHRIPRKRNRWLNAFCCFWLMRRCGLRNSENYELRWEWFRFVGDKIFLDLIERPYFSPKGRAGTVPVARDLYDLLVQVCGPAVPGPEGFVLVGTQSDRNHGAYRCLNIFVRRFIKDRVKAAYEMRKQWGSEMSEEYGIELASTLLRHADLSTSWNHYVGDLKLSKVKPR